MPVPYLTALIDDLGFSSDSRVATDSISTRFELWVSSMLNIHGGALFLSLHTLVMVCDRKNIACYQERTAITSPNRSRHEQHKKAVIWHKIAGICRIFSGKYR